MTRGRVVPRWGQAWMGGLWLVALMSAAAGTGARPRGGSAAFTLSQSQSKKRASGGATTERKAWQILAAGVADEKAEKRADAIAALATIGPRPEVLRLVEPRLTDKEAAVRQAAAASLGAMKAHTAIPKLRLALDDGSADVSFTAARALWEMGDHTGRDIICQVLVAERKPVQEAVGSEMKTAKKTLRNPKSLGLMGAKQGAEMLLGPFSLGLVAIEEIVKDRSVPQRVAAASLLASDRSSKSLEELDAALTDRNWLVRASAARALGARGDLGSVAQLASLLRNDSDPARFMAAAAIIRLRRVRQPVKSP
jgi:HEAT repeat protein